MFVSDRRRTCFFIALITEFLTLFPPGTASTDTPDLNPTETDGTTATGTEIDPPLVATKVSIT